MPTTARRPPQPRGKGSRLIELSWPSSVLARTGYGENGGHTDGRDTARVRRRPQRSSRPAASVRRSGSGHRRARPVRTAGGPGGGRGGERAGRERPRAAVRGGLWFSTGRRGGGEYGHAAGRRR